MGWGRRVGREDEDEIVVRSGVGKWKERSKVDLGRSGHCGWSAFTTGKQLLAIT